MRRLLTLTLGDVKNVTRDGMLLFAILGPIILSVVLGVGVPWVAEFLRGRLGFDLSEHYMFILSFYSLLIPLLLGTLVGFLILDDRDEQVLTYFAVTPLAKAGYMGYRIISPVILCLLFTLPGLAGMGLLRLHLLAVFPVVLVAALEAPMMALFLGTFAGNKVEGLALSKGLGVLLVAPFAGYLIHSPWQLLAGIFPTYWVTKAFLLTGDVGVEYWMYVLVGLTMHLGWVFVLMRQFVKRTE